MTVTKQRMARWNFFLVSRNWYNLNYILFSWKLKQFEVGAKIMVFQEVSKLPSHRKSSTELKIAPLGL